MALLIRIGLRHTPSSEPLLAGDFFGTNPITINPFIQELVHNVAHNIRQGINHVSVSSSSARGFGLVLAGDALYGSHNPFLF